MKLYIKLMALTLALLMALSLTSCIFLPDLDLLPDIDDIIDVFDITTEPDTTTEQPDHTTAPSVDVTTPSGGDTTTPTGGDDVMTDPSDWGETTTEPSAGGNGDGSGGSASEYPYIVTGIPSEGNVNALVIPIQFTNDKFTSQELTDIDRAFNGTRNDTGWMSVSGYYNVSSYGKLDISYTIADVYSVSMTSSALLRDYSEYYSNYEQNYTELDPIELIIDAALKAYDGEYDYTDFDSNGDEYIDAIYIIYSAPICYDSYDQYELELWWSWQTLSYIETQYDGVYTGNFVWSGVDVLYENEANGKADVTFKLNTTTWIHETGHMLGLEDYYDYDTENGPAGGAGGGDMMDSAIGDQGSFSKYQLGWVTPTEIMSNTTVSIGGLSATGNCLIIRKDPSDLDNKGEYLLIDLYIPTAEANAPFNGTCGLPSEALVRIFHINSDFHSETDSDGYLVGGYVYNNTDTEIKLIKLLEQDGNSSIESSEYGEYAADSDYYGAGDRLPTKYTWADGSAFGFTVKINSISGGKASIIVDFN